MSRGEPSESVAIDIPYRWKDLSLTLTTDKFTDYSKIHRFDPTNEHMGGAGKAGRYKIILILKYLTYSISYEY